MVQFDQTEISTMQNAALVVSWESRRVLHVAMASPSGHLSLFVVGNPASHRASRIRMGCEVMSHSRLIHSILSRQVRVAVRRRRALSLACPYLSRVTHSLLSKSRSIAFTLPAAARCKRLVQSHFGASRALTSCESHLTFDRGHTVVTTLQQSLFMFCRPEATRTRAQSVLWPRQDLGETQ